MQNAEYTWLSRFEDWSIISAALHYSVSRLDAVRWGAGFDLQISYTARISAKPARQFLHLGKPLWRDWLPYNRCTSRIRELL